MNLFKTHIKPLIDMIKVSRFARNAFWSLLGAVIMRGLGLLTTVLLVRILGIEVFGQFIALQGALAFFGSLAGLGMGMTITKHIAELKYSNLERAGRIVALCFFFAMGSTVVISLGLWFSSPILCEYIFNSTELLTTFRIVIFVLIANALNGLLDSTFQGLERYKHLSGLTSLFGVLYIIGSSLGAYFYGLMGAVTALAICRLIIALIKIIMLLKIRVPFRIKGMFSETHVIRNYSIPTLSSTLVTGPVDWLPSMVFPSVPGGYAALGIFGAYNQIRSFILFLPDAIGRTNIPLLAESYGAGNKLLFLKQLRRATYMNLTMSLMIAVPFIFFDQVLSNLYNIDYINSQILIIIIGLVSIFIATDNALGYGYICSGKMWKDFMLRFFAMIIFLVLLLVLRSSSFDLVLSIPILHLSYWLTYGIGLLVLLSEFEKKENL
jgi:O-antigen/teichoic acid export membrane protein